MTDNAGQTEVTAARACPIARIAYLRCFPCKSGGQGRSRGRQVLSAKIIPQGFVRWGGVEFHCSCPLILCNGTFAYQKCDRHPLFSQLIGNATIIIVLVARSTRLVLTLRVVGSPNGWCTVTYVFNFHRFRRNRSVSGTCNAWACVDSHERVVTSPTNWKSRRVQSSTCRIARLQCRCRIPL